MNLESFKRLNQSIGNHWFDKDTMGFFKSKIHTWDVVTGYFITSEIDWSDTKRYSIRHANFETGQVGTVGEFHSFLTLHAAKKALSAISPTTDVRTKL